MNCKIKWKKVILYYDETKNGLLCYCFTVTSSAFVGLLQFNTKRWYVYTCTLILDQSCLPYTKVC